MEKVDLIVFDIDGTLVDARQDIVNAVNHMLKSLGLRERSFEEVVSFIGDGLINLLSQSLSKSNEHLIEEARSLMFEYYETHHTDNSKLYAGVEDVLKSFKEKKKYVVTNRETRLGVHALKLLGIEHYFEGIFGADTAACLKPSPCSINKALEASGVAKDKAIIVGDMDVDIIAGKNAGIKTCAVTYGLGKRVDILKANPDYLIEDISELIKIIS